MSKIKKFLPQVSDRKKIELADLLVGGGRFGCRLFFFCYGALSAYPAVLIAQLKKINNLTAVDDFVSITDNDAMWISSVGSPAMIVITILLMFIVDTFGRLNSMRIMVPVFIFGQTLIAQSNNLGTLLAGIAISTGASGCFPTVTSVYIAEISSPSLRGILLSSKPACISFSMLLTYIKGKYLHWRVMAYIISGYAAMFFILSFLIPESSLWLASKNRMYQAIESARWFDAPEPVVAKPKKQQGYWNAFRKPTFYKPMLIVAGFYLFHDLSGSYNTLVNLITFFHDFGTKYDPFTVSIYLALAKLLINLTNAWSMAKFTRRSLTMFSFLGMAISISVSATFTMWVNNGSTSYQWMPPVMLLLFVIFLNCGVIFMPFLMSSEMCPESIRGTTQAISYSISYVVTFVALQLYYLVKKYCASWYIQYYYGVIALGGFLYVYVFLPETHNKTLTEIENYFWLHSNYISSQTEKQKQDKALLLKV